MTAPTLPSAWLAVACCVCGARAQWGGARLAAHPPLRAYGPRPAWPQPVFEPQRNATAWQLDVHAEIKQASKLWALAARSGAPLGAPARMHSYAGGAQLPRVGVVCIARDEGERIAAWAAYYLHVLRAARVFVFDNGVSEAERAPMRAALAPFARSVAYVEFPPRAHPLGQLAAYNSELVHSDRNLDWLLYLDVDEILVLRHAAVRTLPALAALLERAPGRPIVAAEINHRYVGRQHAGAAEPELGDRARDTAGAMRAQTRLTDESFCDVPGTWRRSGGAGSLAGAMGNTQVKTLARRGARLMGVHRLGGLSAAHAWQLLLHERVPAAFLLPRRRGSAQPLPRVVRLSAGVRGCAPGADARAAAGADAPPGARAACCWLDFTHVHINHYHATSAAQVERVSRRGFAHGGLRCDRPLVWSDAAGRCVDAAVGSAQLAPRAAGAYAVQAAAAAAGSSGEYRHAMAEAVDRAAAATEEDRFLADELADEVEAFARACARRCDDDSGGGRASPAVRARCAHLERSHARTGGC